MKIAIVGFEGECDVCSVYFFAENSDKVQHVAVIASSWAMKSFAFHHDVYLDFWEKVVKAIARKIGLYSCDFTEKDIASDMNISRKKRVFMPGVQQNFDFTYEFCNPEESFQSIVDCEWRSRDAVDYIFGMADHMKIYTFFPVSAGSGELVDERSLKPRGFELELNVTCTYDKSTVMTASTRKEWIQLARKHFGWGFNEAEWLKTNPF